jgi:hypothetical protein
VQARAQGERWSCWKGLQGLKQPWRQLSTALYRMASTLRVMAALPTLTLVLYSPRLLAIARARTKALRSTLTAACEQLPSLDGTIEPSLNEIVVMPPSALDVAQQDHAVLDTAGCAAAKAKVSREEMLKGFAAKK